MLYKFDKILAKNELEKKIKDDIVQTFRNLRILSMNIVNHYMRIKENTSHHILSGKFDSDILFKLIQYDKNYILKLKNDTDFLYGSSINKYFDFAPESDPFLIALSGKTENISEYGNTKLEHKEKNIINF